MRPGKKSGLSYGTELKAIEQKQRQAATETVVVTAKPTATVNAQQQTHAVHQRRGKQQQELRKLHEQQWSQIAIAQAVGVSVRTVRRFRRLPNLSATPPRRRSFGRSLLDSYKPALLAWWNAGIKQLRLLMTLLQQQGYTGSQRTLTRHISRLREAQGLPPTRVQPIKDLPQVIAPQSPPLTARRATYLILQREDNRAPEDTELNRPAGYTAPKPGNSS